MSNPENLMEGLCYHITHVALSAHFLSVPQRRTADTWADYELTITDMVKPSIYCKKHSIAKFSV